MGRRRLRRSYSEAGRVTAHVLGVLLMLLVVAVQAQIFPITAVGRVVVVVMVFVVHGQFVQIAPVELPTAATANPGVDTQRLFPVAVHTLVCPASGLGNDLVELC